MVADAHCGKTESCKTKQTNKQTNYNFHAFLVPFFSKFRSAFDPSAFSRREKERKDRGGKKESPTHSLTHSLTLCVRVRVCARARACVCGFPCVGCCPSRAEKSFQIFAVMSLLISCLFSYETGLWLEKVPGLTVESQLADTQPWGTSWASSNASSPRRRCAF